MRDLLSKLMTGSMIAGAALLVAACGGSEEANTTNNYVEDPLMGNDAAVTDADPMNGTTDNLGAAANTTETNTTTTTTTTDTNTTTSTDTATNGM